ncbi:MAG: hypothetical protein EOP13_18400 [Pseudomonas sp.]|uniref:hypothetical protein n=1 Tax=Pseudomonas sp. TaxID=306 RepID=UPI001229CD0A|nr:hypothetical protein [Pseudomonas sp.]RZI71318.1 MAG: hypothetical protein EOP13_18400 [Pseudomonas sp.]
MSMEGNYAWEKLHIAVLILAGGTGTLQERLADAYLSSLMRLRPDKHFPWPDLRQDFEDMMQELAPGGNTQAALSAWPDEDLRRIAEGIVGLCDRVLRKTTG